jgi:hypothetical protein
MIYDKLGLTRDNGSSDFQDSSRLAALAVIFLNAKIDLSYYVKFNGKAYTYHRHPDEYKYTFSRDQASCLFAGLYFNKMKHLIDYSYKIENGDIVTPSVRDHFRRCAGLKSSFIGNLFLIIDILFSAYIQPLAEPNQLICMLMTHEDKKYLKLWCKLNKNWKKAINVYWCGWRNEPELALAMINRLEYESIMNQ